ncbi:hypothetical protein JCM10213_004406 [Rhodosporidiobolus nylandii]
MRLLPLLLAPLLLAWGTAAHATVKGELRLNGTDAVNGLGGQGWAVLSPLPVSESPSGGEHPQRTAEIYGPEGEYHFAFPAVPAGEYVLRFVTRRWGFPEYAVKVDEQDLVSVSLYSPILRSSIPGSSLPYPLVATSLLSLSHPPAAPPFSLLTFLKGNPMVWIMLVGVGLAVGTPKLMQSLDEDTLREVGETQGRLFGGAQALPTLDPSTSLSRYLSGSSPEADSSSSPGALAGSLAAAKDEGKTGGGGGGGAAAGKRRGRGRK